jgi:hypothetical protein
MCVLFNTNAFFFGYYNASLSARYSFLDFFNAFLSDTNAFFGIFWAETGSTNECRMSCGARHIRIETYKQPDRHTDTHLTPRRSFIIQRDYELVRQVTLVNLGKPQGLIPDWIMLFSLIDLAL